MKKRRVVFIVSAVCLGCLCCAGWHYYKRANGYGDPIRVPAKALSSVTVSILDTDSRTKEFQRSDAKLGSALIDLVNTSTPTIYCPVGNIGTITFSYADGSTNIIGFVPDNNNRYRLVELAPPNSGRDILSYSTVDKQRFVSIMTQYGIDATWLEWPHLRKTKAEGVKSETVKSTSRSNP